MKRFFGINWVQRQAHDHYVKQAKSMGYRSRAAFKLVEMNKRFNILKPGMRVIDLGAAPGGWSQVAAELVKSTPEKRIVFSVDLQHFDPIPGCYNMCLDMSNTSSLEELLKYMDGPVDLLLSDMSGNHSGDKDVDCNMMTGLNLDALYVAKHTLKKGGNVLMKMLYGPDEPEHFVIHYIESSEEPFY